MAMRNRRRLREIIRRKQCQAIAEKYASYANIVAMGGRLLNGDDIAVR